MESVGYLSQACRLFVAIVLLAAAGGKTLHFARFRDGLAKSFPAMGRASTAAALAIVLAEWIVGALVLSPGMAARTLGLLAALALFALFATVIAWSLIQDRAIACSCFGASTHRITPYDLLRNLLFIGASAVAWRHAQAGLTLDSAAWAMLAGFAFIAFLIATALQDIALLLRTRADG